MKKTAKEMLQKGRKEAYGKILVNIEEEKQREEKEDGQRNEDKE